MADMRKLMEAVEQLSESWDPGAIADAIYNEITDDWENPVKDAFSNPDEPEPYRAAIYTYGKLSGLYNPETLDGSEIYHSIVDSLEDRFWEKVTPDDIKRAQMGEDADDSDVESKHRSDEEYMQDVMKLCDEGDEALMDEGMNPQAQLEVLAQVLQDISNMTRLRASGRGYAPIHEGVNVREVTIKIIEMMDEGVMDPRTVADAALSYMSEAEVADMARANDWWLGDDDAYESVNEDAKGYAVFHAGPVEVKVGMGEVVMYHGHGENIYLRDNEFEQFFTALQQKMAARGF